jgi:hypothetical protein
MQLRALIIMATLGGVWLSQPTLAADSLADCRNIAEQAARLACYDRVAGVSAPAAPVKPVTPTAPSRATQSSIPARIEKVAPSSAPAVQAETKAVTPSDAVAAFGTKETTATVEASADGEQVLTDTVASIKIVQPEVREITLSSGQVWRQRNSQPFRLTAGDKVSIKPSIWGSSYRLSVERLNSFIQVERIK